MDLTKIPQNKVSTDLSSYTIVIYGKGGAGKTTFACTPPGTLLLAFEKGYKAIPGVRAVDILTWKMARDVEKELAKPEVKAMYNNIAIDTMDFATQYLSKWICNQKGIQTLGEGGWTVNGWDAAKKEWERFLNNITMMGYGLTLISHEKERTITRKDGTSYTAIAPSVSNVFNEIARNKADIEAYINLHDNGKRELVLRSNGAIECKSRFKMIEPVLEEFSYESLENAISHAIEMEAAGTSFITDERATDPKLTIEEAKSQFNSMIDYLKQKPDFEHVIAPRIQAICDTVSPNKPISSLVEADIDIFLEILGQMEELAV